MFEKCPFCGNMTAGEIEPTLGTTYVLTTADTSKNPPNFLSNHGLMVKLVGCSSCKRIQLVCDAISEHK